MKKLVLFIVLVLLSHFPNPIPIFAQERPIVAIDETEMFEATASSTTLENTPEPIPSPRPDLTQKTEETLEPLHKLLNEQELGAVFPGNPLKYAIRASVAAGVPPNTLVLLLLLPGVAALIAAARHIVGIRGFGIFLPAALAVTFVATGPLIGIGLFLVIVFVSTFARISMRRLKFKLQYLPRMALILLLVVFGILVVLFLTPIIRQPQLTNVSIFPVLILVLLAEDFSRVQFGKSAKVAINLTTETLILALVSYIFLTIKIVQQTALLHPEAFILTVIFIDVMLGRYLGLRFLELWRFRKLINK
ncbi:hypothetical protein A3H19_01905 [Candidatus Woesebacteria bacterium RIFCSPLOWO2_12_FULL_39_9]|nr:MAG: hypothetical protein A3H19_01905 [Candidatus Woesebacteria bacterium RIFCSPLOWO2_12_FULL_39_9]